jgi:hypothetical protein
MLSFIETASCVQSALQANSGEIVRGAVVPVRQVSSYDGEYTVRGHKRHGRKMVSARIFYAGR